MYPIPRITHHWLLLMKTNNEDSLIRESNFTPTGSATGGKTESYQAKDKDGVLHQIKFSQVRQAVRRISGYQTDRSDILGEYIGSAIAEPVFNTGDTELTPKVSLLIGGDNELCLASKYLNADKQGMVVMTIDDLLEKTGGKKEKGSGHAQIDFTLTEQKTGSTTISPDVNYTYQDKNKNNISIVVPKKDLVDVVVNSMILGDHDINPGNIMVIHDKKTEESRAGRIDFGHAINNLIKNWFGVGADQTPRIPKDRGCILDALNRTDVNGVNKPTKFRRDYKGVLFDDVFIEKMQNANAQEARFIEGVNQAVAELAKIAEATKGDKALQDDLKKSIASLAAKSGNPIQLWKNMSVEMVIANFQVSLTDFVMNNVAETVSVGNVLKVQKEIDAFLKGDSEVDFKKIQAIYEADKKYLIGKNFNDKVEWVRPDGDEKLVKGSLKEYIEHRAKSLGIDPTTVLYELGEHKKAAAGVYKPVELLPDYPVVELKSERVVGRSQAPKQVANKKGGNDTELAGVNFDPNKSKRSAVTPKAKSTER